MDFRDEQTHSLIERERKHRAGGENKDYEALYRAVEALPRETSEILWLHYQYGYSARELAKQYGKSTNGIHQILSRARKQLKGILQEEEL